jgi:dihydrodipicolinate synthase/N-acetylneuraminate lyase
MRRFLTRQTFKGLYAVLPTPFDRGGRLSRSLFSRMLETVARFGIDGVVLAGTYGEYFSLREEEKLRMTEIAAQALEPTRIHLVVNGTALSLGEQIRLGRKLRDAGAQALMNLAPLSLTLTDAEYRNFWKRLADGVGDVGLVIYNLDNRSMPPSPQALLAVARAVPSVCGTKEGHRDIERWHYVHTNSDITAMPANDYQWMEYYKKGSCSFMTPSVGMSPPLACRIHKGYLDRQWKRTMPLQEVFVKLWDKCVADTTLLAGFGGIARYKAVCKALGWIDPGCCRPPLIDVPQDIQLRLNRDIEQEFPEYCRTDR